MFLLFLISKYFYPCDIIWYNATCSKWVKFQRLQNLELRALRLSLADILFIGRLCVPRPWNSSLQWFRNFVRDKCTISELYTFQPLLIFNQCRGYCVCCIVFLQRRLKKRNWSSIALNGKEVRNRIKIEKEMVKLKWKFWKMRKRRRGRSRQKYKAQWKVNIVL